jgi:hypothetical protein
MSVNDREALEVLELRLRAMLPEEYQSSYEDLQPVSMGSAGLKFDADGRVAWDEIWATFCDLAMAGGPPHKGALLEPGTAAEIGAQPDRYDHVTEELCRGITMVADLTARRSPTPGWVRVSCFNEGMAGWLLRAIVMENVAARCQGTTLDLPAAPHFRLEKEVKNVITVIAKTCHYWTGHMPRVQQNVMVHLFANIAAESPLIEPALASDGPPSDSVPTVVARMASVIHRDTGLPSLLPRYAGWLGVECASVRSAIWMMRAMVVSNVLSRREGTVLFVPLNPASDPDGDIVTSTLARVHRLAGVKGVL